MELNVLETRVSPFHCGTQHADWQSSNCDRCKKNKPSGDCQIQDAIFDSMFGDGSMDQTMAMRMGWDGDVRSYNWKCGEVECTDEWIAESRRRRTFKYRSAKWCRDTYRGVRNWIRETYRKWREKLLMPIAVRRGLKSQNECWTEWASWAMWPGTEKPSLGGGDACRSEANDRGSCWCGKFNTAPEADNTKGK